MKNNLKIISFVGVDKFTDFNALLTFKEQPIECEFSVLFSETKSGNRYPGYEFCKNYLSWAKSNKLMASLHLCGDAAINKYLNQDFEIMELCKDAVRIQLNMNIASYPDYDKLSNEIINAVKKHNHVVILQKNKSKEKFLKTFLSKEDCPHILINLLYDSSGGFGREINQISPLGKKIEAGEIDEDGLYATGLVGYAGGIKPENVVNIIKLIENANTDNKHYYIDMESGIRDNNILSLEKCRDIIDNILK